jgi:hypothetical protein
MKEKISLQDKFPKLVKQWDFEKNIIKPTDISYGSGRKVWWKCDVCYRSYLMRIDNRVFASQSCPFCSGNKVCAENCLGSKKPYIIPYWHPVKNGNLTPYDVMPGSTKKYWLLCPVCNLSYQRDLNSIDQNHKCPYCCGRKVCISNCLYTKLPNLIKEWHPYKNANLTPKDVTCGTDKIVWWLCLKCNESYRAKISARTILKYNCPYCAGKRVSNSNCLATKNPEIAKEWDLILNGNLTSQCVTSGSKKHAWWICPKCKSSYKSRINNRTRENNPSSCPHCVMYHKEKQAIDIIEKITQKPFKPTNTIPWLVNTKTGRRYQVDGYSVELNVILEHQGEQHCKVLKKFHPNGLSDFFYQLHKDAEKYRLCKENDCILICTYYNQTYKEIHEHILKTLVENNKI